jgi:hypothetical protein
VTPTTTSAPTTTVTPTTTTAPTTTREHGQGWAWGHDDDSAGPPGQR